MFIPKRINVGFQDKEVANYIRLAYVIYWDEKGILRKELSWNKWRNQDVPAKEFDNEPTEGFRLNLRAGGWGQRKTYCEVIDPRGFMVEITIDNLLELLADCDCEKKVLKGKFVYAWYKTELRIIMVGTEEYAFDVAETQKAYESVEKPEKIKNQKNTLIPFHIYKDTVNGEMVYLGRMNVYDVDNIFWSPYYTGSKCGEWLHRNGKRFDYSKIDDFCEVEGSMYRYKIVSKMKYCFIRADKSVLPFKYDSFRYYNLISFVSLPKRMFTDVGIVSKDVTYEIKRKMQLVDIFSPVKLKDIRTIDLTEELFNEILSKYYMMTIIGEDGKCHDIDLRNGEYIDGVGYTPYNYSYLTKQFGKSKVYDCTLENGNKPEEVDFFIDCRRMK